MEAARALARAPRAAPGSARRASARRRPARVQARARPRARVRAGRAHRGGRPVARARLVGVDGAADAVARARRERDGNEAARRRARRRRLRRRRRRARPTLRRRRATSAAPGRREQRVVAWLVLARDRGGGARGHARGGRGGAAQRAHEGRGDRRALLRARASAADRGRIARSPRCERRRDDFAGARRGARRPGRLRGAFGDDPDARPASARCAARACFRRRRTRCATPSRLTRGPKNTSGEKRLWRRWSGTPRAPGDAASQARSPRSRRFAKTRENKASQESPKRRCFPRISRLCARTRTSSARWAAEARRARRGGGAGGAGVSLDAEKTVTDKTHAVTAVDVWRMLEEDVLFLKARGDDVTASELEPDGAAYTAAAAAFLAADDEASASALARAMRRRGVEVSARLYNVFIAHEGHKKERRRHRARAHYGDDVSGPTPRRTARASSRIAVAATSNPRRARSNRAEPIRTRRAGPPCARTPRWCRRTRVTGTWRRSTKHSR